MKKAQHEALQPYERALKSARDNGFVRLGMNDFIKIADIYEEIYDKALTTSEKNCSRCRLKAMQKLAADYFNYKPVGRPKAIDLNAES